MEPSLTELRAKIVEARHAAQLTNKYEELSEANTQFSMRFFGSAGYTEFFQPVEEAYREDRPHEVDWLRGKKYIEDLQPCSTPFKGTMVRIPDQWRAPMIEEPKNVLLWEWVRDNVKGDWRVIRVSRENHFGERKVLSIVFRDISDAVFFKTRWHG